MKRAAVTGCEALGDRLRLITLEGPALQGVEWLPGHKIQIAMGSAFLARTYTPIEWDALIGRTRILAFAHGTGPGSDWVRRANIGDECDLFGPRASLDLRQLEGPIAVFGDETSLGLAHAMARHDPCRVVSGYFEVCGAAVGAAMGDRLGRLDGSFFETAADQSHVAAMEARLPSLIAGGSAFVLTGKAGTVQRLRQALKLRGVPAARIKAKAYWAPGKVGMD
ncbi:siderophore-interacting protein [Novosphingobium sp. BL-8A]|uniref:siderophore-interacting protein n=1 Tax=Novosphingobium sp. BL-8A TaxID=3127639 RepID=UPI00375798D5